MSEKATLNVNGGSYDLPLLKSSEGELCIEISKLRVQSNGITTIDRGFKNTASCESKITYLDGEKGILRYRGYSIEELASKASFLEVAYLLIFCELPDKDELENYTDKGAPYGGAEGQHTRGMEKQPNAGNPNRSRFTRY